MTGIHPDRPEFLGRSGYEFNILPDEAAKHLVHIEEDVVEVDYVRLSLLTAREGQKLSGEFGGPIGRSQDLFEVLIQTVGRVEIHQP